MAMKNNEQHTIDTAVRQALENLEIPFNADHWKLMDGKLDALNSEEADFDTNLANVLRGVATPYVATHWNLMNSKLDALNAEDADFDKNIAQKIADVQVPFEAAHWMDMSDRLDELDGAESSFDALMRQKMENAQPQMPENHWAMMEERLEEAFSWRRKIVRYKVVEVALLLLTFFTAWNMLDLPFDSLRSVDNSVQSPNVIEAKKNNEAKKMESKKVKEKTFYDPTDWRSRPATPNSKRQLEQGAKDKGQFEQGANGKPIVSTENGTWNEFVNQFTNPSTTVNGTTNNGIENVENQPIATRNLPKNAHYTEGGELNELPTRTIPILGKVRDDEAYHQDVATIAAKELNPTAVLKPRFLADTRFYDANITYPKSKDKRPKWRLNSFVLPIADFVTTKSYQYRKPVIDTQIAANLGAGIAVGYKKGRLEFEGGLSYLDKKYDLPNVEIITGGIANLRTSDTGYTKTKPQNLHLSILSIPLSVNYTVKETNRWRFYTRIGVALNTILKAKESEYVESSDAKPKKIDPNKYEGNQYSEGLLRTSLTYSKFKANSYITANAGIGVEYRLTNNTDIYIQPTFDYHYGQGIGTLNDRIHSFSVQGGVKTKLK